MMGEFHVYSDSYAGKCYWTERRGRITSVFAYDGEYLSNSEAWSIDPQLTLTAGKFLTVPGEVIV